MTGLDNSIDLPFEASSGDLHDADDALFSGGVVVMASVVDVPEVGPTPALVFRFATPQGAFYPPFVLVAADDQLAKLRPLVVEAIVTARNAAKIAQAGGRSA